MIRVLFIAIVLLSLGACNNPSDEQTATQAQDTIATDANELIKEAIAEETDTVLTTAENQAISEKTFRQATSRMAQNNHNFSFTISDNYGVYVITQPGALPKVEHVYQLDLQQFSTAISLEQLPQFSCDHQAYDKEGCFGEAVNPLHESQLWNYTNMNEKEKQAVIAQAETIKYTIVDTQHKTTYYFSEIEGEWYLTFVDFRVPCTA